MIYKTTVEIPKHILREINAILRGGVHQLTAEDVMYSITAEFKNGFQADIKLVNGDPPYVDPVLFDKGGNEIAVGEPDAETFNGEYRWEVGVSPGRGEYIATVKAR